MKAVLFDLDDTLYPEVTFVESGFRAAAQVLASRHDLEATPLVRRMMAILERDGRGRVFDTLLRELGLYRPDFVHAMVLAYRTHRPEVRLYEDAPAVLNELQSRDLALGVLTDGMASVQRHKIVALGLEPWLDVILCTDELGPEHSKPSPLPYQVALEFLRVPPAEAAYVGNDPGKDFAGARAIGMRTVRVRRHPSLKGPGVGEEEDADVTIDCFGDLPPVVGT